VTQPASRRTPRRRGFTIPEILTAFALVGIVAGFTVPRLDWARWEADAGVRQIRVALQGAQRLALTQQSTVVVGIDSANARVRILEDVNGNLAADAGERVTWRPMEGTVRFTAPPTLLPGAVAGAGSGAALMNVGPRAVDGYPSLVFRRDGSASASATIYVSTTRRRDVEYRALVITQSTGRIDWWRAAGRAPLTWIRGSI